MGCCSARAAYENTLVDPPVAVSSQHVSVTPPTPRAFSIEQPPSATQESEAPSNDELAIAPPALLDGSWAKASSAAEPPSDGTPPPGTSSVQLQEIEGSGDGPGREEALPSGCLVESTNIPLPPEAPSGVGSQTAVSLPSDEQEEEDEEQEEEQPSTGAEAPLVDFSSVPSQCLVEMISTLPPLSIPMHSGVRPDAEGIAGEGEGPSLPPQRSDQSAPERASPPLAQPCFERRSSMQVLHYFRAAASLKTTLSLRIHTRGGRVFPRSFSASQASAQLLAHGMARSAEEAAEIVAHLEEIELLRCVCEDPEDPLYRFVNDEASEDDLAGEELQEADVLGGLPSPPLSCSRPSSLPMLSAVAVDLGPSATVADGASSRRASGIVPTSVPMPAGDDAGLAEGSPLSQSWLSGEGSRSQSFTTPPHALLNGEGSNPAKSPGQGSSASSASLRLVFREAENCFAVPKLRRKQGPGNGGAGAAAVSPSSHGSPPVVTAGSSSSSSSSSTASPSSCTPESVSEPRSIPMGLARD
eukprot:RCo029488